jgi:hypothetical protein
MDGNGVIFACRWTAASRRTSMVWYQPWGLIASGPVEDEGTDDHGPRGFRCHLTVFASPLP